MLRYKQVVILKLLIKSKKGFINGNTKEDENLTWSAKIWFCGFKLCIKNLLSEDFIIIIVY